MRRSALAIAAALFTMPLSAAWGAESILNSLQLGETTPQELNELYPGMRTEIPKESYRRVVHFTDGRGSKGVCHFVGDRLVRYTVTLDGQSPDVVASGGWDGMVAAAESAFGTPKVVASARRWDLERFEFQLSREREGRIAVTLCDKSLERVLQRQVAVMQSPPTHEHRVAYGGPYHLNGFRSEVTRTVTLTRGRYRVTLEHSGHGNFIVHMYSPWSMEHVANEIGWCHVDRVISVEGEAAEYFFLVKDADGPWTIDVKKLPLPTP